MDNGYRRLLELGIRHRWKVVVMTVAVVMSSGYFFGHIGKGFMPEEDESRFMITFKTPTGSGIEYTEERLMKIEAVLNAQPEIRSFFTLVGGNSGGEVSSGTAIVRMVPHSGKRKPAPTEARTSVMGRVQPRGAPLRTGLWLKERWVFAIQSGRCERPISVKS